MNYYRYVELANAGPKISKEDRARLASFRPRRSRIANAVRAALAQIRRGG